jgi:hypothetical protein
VAWAAARFAVSGDLDLLAARDLAPYVYMLVVLAAAFATTSYGRTLKVVEAALLLHLLWVLVTLLAPGWTSDLPLLGGKVRVLELRPDFDGAVLAVTAGLAATLAASRGPSTSVRAGAAVVAVGSVVTVLQLGSRSGVLALGAAVLVLAATQVHTVRRFSWRRLLATAAVLVALAALVLPHTYVFDRATADPRRTDAGAGTIGARQHAWALVLDDAARTPGRLFLGSGFGPDFLDRSGARKALEGNANTGVRAPHNFVLNTLGRLGLVGVALLGWAVVAVLRASIRVRRPSPGDPERDRFMLLGVLLVGTLGVAAMFGVILESPFGAVPFWWAAGLLLVGADPCQRGTVANAGHSSAAATGSAGAPRP